MGARQITQRSDAVMNRAFPGVQDGAKVVAAADQLWEQREEGVLLRSMRSSLCEQLRPCPANDALPCATLSRPLRGSVRRFTPACAAGVPRTSARGDGGCAGCRGWDSAHVGEGSLPRAVRRAAPVERCACVPRHDSRASSPYPGLCPCLKVSNRAAFTRLAYAAGTCSIPYAVSRTRSAAPGRSAVRHRQRSGSGSRSQSISSPENAAGSSSCGKCPSPSNSRQR